ncbi:MAG: hypothetical protein Q8736_02820, partial [Sweet potato little leaf phytoplasma]|nr:hypothetical protein [Sweet potato little leaf phytoplasma]
LICATDTRHNAHFDHALQSSNGSFTKPKSTPLFYHLRIIIIIILPIQIKINYGRRRRRRTCNPYHHHQLLQVRILIYLFML